MRVVVVGGGVSGLGSALTLARQGHSVEVIERDDTPMPASADEAFEWDRRGAPQVRHSHAFLARLVGMLRRDHPDVYAELLAEGATEMRFGDDLPPPSPTSSAEADDDELVMLACRRTTFEWVLRRAALAEGACRSAPAWRSTGCCRSDEPGRPARRGACVSSTATRSRPTWSWWRPAAAALPEWLPRSAHPRCPRRSRTPASSTSAASTACATARRTRRAPARSAATSATSSTACSSATTSTFSVTLATLGRRRPAAQDARRPGVFDDVARQLVATAPWLDGRAEPLIGAPTCT
jgi:glycine/D-amino acid oxidase-like deaminating enzyme